MRAPADDIIARLPHGEAFRFLNEVRLLTPGEAISATWRVDGTEPFFAAHFPADPIVPGVLLGEALAQAAGLAVMDVASPGEAAPGRATLLLAHIDIRLRAPVRPPATIALEATLSRAMNAMFLFDVAATVNGTVAASGRLALATNRQKPSPHAASRKGQAS